MHTNQQKHMDKLTITRYKQSKIQNVNKVKERTGYPTFAKNTVILTDTGCTQILIMFQQRYNSDHLERMKRQTKKV